ncbi:MAG: hypothetical protein ACFBQW_07835 [Sphingomonadaceae bacterium]
MCDHDQTLFERDYGSHKLEFRELVTILAAQQALTPTARAQARAASPARRDFPPQASLARLLAGGPGWRDARASLDGRFHHGVPRDA